MINSLLESYFQKNKKLAIEHRDSLYAVYASCDKVFNNITKHQGFCHRAAYYSCMGLGEKSRTLNHSLSSKMGDSVEGLLLWLLKDTDTLYDKGVKFKLEKYNVSGKLDAILLINDEKFGLEIKSLSSNEWINNKIFGSRWNSPFPKLEHLLQCIVYLYAFINDIQKFQLFYIRRDNGETKEFTIELALLNDVLFPVIDGTLYTDINCNNIMEKFEKLNYFIENDTVPPRSYSIEYSQDEIDLLYKNKFITKSRYEKYNSVKFGDFECMNCSYKDICIKDGE